MDSQNERLGSLMAFSDIALIISTYGVLFAFNHFVEPIGINTWIVCTFFVGIKILIVGIADITGIGRSILVSILFLIVADGVIVLINQIMAFSISLRMLLIVTVADIVMLCIAILIWKGLDHQKAQVQPDQEWLHSEDTSKIIPEADKHPTQLSSPDLEEIFVTETPSESINTEKPATTPLPAGIKEGEDVFSFDSFNDSEADSLLKEEANLFSRSETIPESGLDFLSFEEITTELPVDEVEEELFTPEVDYMSQVEAEETEKTEEPVEEVEETVEEIPEVSEPEEEVVISEETIEETPEVVEEVTSEEETIELSEETPEEPIEQTEELIEETVEESPEITETVEEETEEVPVEVEPQETIEETETEEVSEEPIETVQVEEVPEEEILEPEETEEVVETETTEEIPQQEIVPVETTETVEESTEEVPPTPSDQVFDFPIFNQVTVREPVGIVDSERYEQITGVFASAPVSFPQISVDVDQTEIDDQVAQIKETQLKLNANLDKMIELFNNSEEGELLMDRIPIAEQITEENTINEIDSTIRTKLRELIGKQFIKEDVLRSLINTANRIKNHANSVEMAQRNLNTKIALEKQREEEKKKQEQLKEQIKEQPVREETVQEVQAETVEEKQPEVQENEVHLQNDGLDIIIDKAHLALLKEFLKQQDNAGNN